METKLVQVETIKPLLLEVLISIDKYCKCHGLRYSIAFGTLIGSVRHHGFIPWDDDIDIWMPRPDYDHFIKNFEDGKFKVISAYNTDGYPVEYAKVHNSQTILYEAGAKCIWGIGVDVFPVDGVPSEKAGKKLMSRIRKLRRLMANQKSTYLQKMSRQAGVAKNASILIGRMLHPFLSYKKIVLLMDRMLKSYNFDSCELVCDLTELKPNIVHKSFIEEFVELEFEGHHFMASAHYDAWLRLIFGDYMQLPPENERISIHDIMVYWK